MEVLEVTIKYITFLVILKVLKCILALENMSDIPIQGKFSPDVERGRIIKAREEAEKEILAKVPVTSREVFATMLKSAQACARHMEDHNWWYEFRSHGLFRRAALELGKRMAKHGALDEPEDFLGWIKGI